MILTIHDELLLEGPPEEVDAVARAAGARWSRRGATARRRWPSTSASARTWLAAK